MDRWDGSICIANAMTCGRNGVSTMKDMRLLAIALTLSVFSALFALETAPVKVLSVYDGDTITVAGELGGQEYPVKVRLLYLDTPEVRGNKHGKAMEEGRQARDFLRKVLPEGTMVTLWCPGDELKRDGYGRVLAVVNAGGANVNAGMITTGWSPYWRKYGEPPDEKMHKFLLKCHNLAKSNRRGAWGTNWKWMVDKSNERTAKR